MAKGLTLDIAANTRDFQKGTKDVEGALDKVADALDDVSRDGDKAGEKLERSFSDAQRDISRSSKKIGTDLSKEVKHGTDGAKEGLDDFKQEANQTARESAASFDGSASSIVDAFQETAANAFGGFGPAGALAGIAAAAGIGLVGKAFADASVDAEKLKEKTKTTFDQMIESKSEFIGQDIILTNLHELISDTEELAKATKVASTLGVDQTTVLRALAGDASALTDAQGALVGKQRELADSRAKLEKQGILASDANVKLSKSLDEASAALDVQSGSNAAAREQFRLYNKAAADIASSNDAALRSTEKLTDGVGRLGSGLNLVPKEITPKVTLTVDTAEAERALTRFAQRRRDIQVGVVYRNGKPVI